MITLERLIETVSTKLTDVQEGESAQRIQTRNWERICAQLTPHQEPYPAGPFYTDEYGNEIQDYEYEEVGGYAETNDEEITALCWEQGCTIGNSVDYWTGEITYSISLPESEEEYQRNLEEYKAWEEENF